MAKDELVSKPAFFTRTVAFLIDGFLVLFLATLLATPFVNKERLSSFSESSRALVEKYSNGEITDKEYEVESSNLSYQISVSMELITLTQVFIGLVYFVVLPLYNKGQTLGKKIMKLKIISTMGELSSNQLIFRSFIVNSVLLNLLSVIFLMFTSRDVYTICVQMFTFVQYIVFLISIIMVIVDKNGLSVHDRVVHTKVVKVN